MPPRPACSPRWIWAAPRDCSKPIASMWKPMPASMRSKGRKRFRRSASRSGKASRMSGLLHAIKDQEFGAAGQLQHGVLAVEAEPFDGPVQGAQHEDAQGNDFDVGANFAGATRIEEQFVPVLGVGPAQRTMWLLQRLGQLAVDTDIGGGEIAGFEQRDQMGFDRESDLAPMGDRTGIAVGFLDCFEHAEQPEVEDLVEDLLLGIEVVVNAASLDVGDFGDLAQCGGRVSLAPKQPGRRYQNRIA